jgi:hypothetical protein
MQIGCDTINLVTNNNAEKTKAERKNERRPNKYSEKNKPERLLLLTGFFQLSELTGPDGLVKENQPNCPALRDFY